MKSSDLFFAFVGGAALGALAGILLAPDKGSETRKKIVDTAKDFSTGIHDKLDDLKESVNSTIDDMKETLHHERMRAEAEAKTAQQKVEDE